MDLRAIILEKNWFYTILFLQPNLFLLDITFAIFL